MLHYVVYDPRTGEKLAGYHKIGSAFRRAYGLLPAAPAHSVRMQEFNAAGEPLRQWLICGRNPPPVTYRKKAAGAGDRPSGPPAPGVT